MIYQFKVELEYEDPSVWRRLEVDSEMTFVQFHHVLQAAFGWENSHLHKFSIEQRDGKRVEGVEIGMDLEGFELSMKEVLDEEKEKLADWFIREQDCAVYTYDFGDDWRHKIILEKILPKVAGERYPRCIEAVQIAPEEDSRGMMDEVAGEVVDWRILTKEVNEALAKIDGSAIDDAFDWVRLFDEAKAFNKLKPWELFDDNQVFVVVDPTSGVNLYCSVLGAMGEEFGMAVYIGQEGLQSLKDTFENIMVPFELIIRQRSLLLSFVNRDELVDTDYKLIKSHGLTFRGRKQWVQFRSLRPGSYPWALDEEEARMLLVAIEQAQVICERAKAGLVVPVMHRGKDVFPARVGIERDGQIEWAEDVIKVEKEQVQVVDSPLLISELDVARANKQERHNRAIEFDLFHVDFPIQVEEGERPHFPIMAMAVERKTGIILYQNLFNGAPRAENAQQALVDFVEEVGFRPREIWMTGKMKAMLAPIIKSLRADIMAVENLQHIESVKGFLAEMK